ncbi:M23 family metallopeptidase (plasmid) [Coraliomargarita sp. W4R53]
MTGSDPSLQAHTRFSRIRPARMVAVAVATALLLVTLAPSKAVASVHTNDSAELSSQWEWPLRTFELTRPFVAPANEYAAGHRGVDLRAVGGYDVLAPAAGTVAFVGSVAGRDVLTLDHGGGLVTTLEPISAELQPGDSVSVSEVVGEVSVGGHAASGELHVGLRLDGEYINPQALFGALPRAVLLPCCD